MPNEIIVISKDAIGNIICDENARAVGKLEWNAPGIDIYLRGSWSITMYAKAANMAINCCINRNIPTFSLRRVAK